MGVQIVGADLNVIRTGVAKLSLKLFQKISPEPLGRWPEVLGFWREVIGPPRVWAILAGG